MLMPVIAKKMASLSMYMSCSLPLEGLRRGPTEYLLDLGCERGSLGGSQRIKAITQQVV